jgi:DNA-binding NarL/FixJ family response regulator
MTRVLIIAEVRLYRDGLARLLRREHDLEVIGVASHPDRGLALSADGTPDIVLLGVSPSIQPSVVGRLEAVAPATRVIAIAGPERDADILAWAEAGAAAYITREQSLAELRETIRRVGQGQTLCSPLVSGALMRRVARMAEPAAVRPAALTSRENQVLELIERGLSNKEIATALTIQLATVKNHVHNILGKLGVDRRWDAVDRFRPVTAEDPVLRGHR